MRIAIVTPSLDRSFTGVTSYVRDVVPHLCDAGLKVTVATTDVGYRGVAATAIADLDNRVDLRLLPVQGRLNRRLYRSVHLKNWLTASAGGFDLVDIQNIWSFVAADAAAVCLRTSTPFVFTPHGSMTRWDWAKRQRSKRIFYTLSLKRVWQHATAVRFLSQGELDSSMVPPAGPAAVIPNATLSPTKRDYVEAGRCLRSKIGIPESAPVILFLGRLTAQKSVIELVQAFEFLWSRRPETFLMLAGPPEGGYGESVRSLVASGSSRENVRMPGPLHGEKKYAAFAAASLFVTLSQSEGFPIAAVEAISSGLPVVLTPESNFPEVGAYGAGVIVGRDPAQVARVLESLLDNSERLREMGRNALRLYRENYTWEKVLPQLLSFYESVARGSTDAPRRRDTLLAAHQLGEVP